MSVVIGFGTMLAFIGGIIKFIILAIVSVVVISVAYVLSKDINLLGKLSKIDNDVLPSTASSTELFINMFNTIASHFGTEPNLWSKGQYAYKLVIDQWKLTNVPGIKSADAISYADNTRNRWLVINILRGYFIHDTITFEIEDSEMIIKTQRYWGKPNLISSTRTHTITNYKEITFQQLIDEYPNANSFMVIFRKLYEGLIAQA